MTEIENFNVRVYGLIVNSENEILTSLEMYGDRRLHKFVGGGLEKGEGLKNCLEREFLEELNCEIEVKDLYYVNDFFQASYFKKEDQIISVYYFIEPRNWNVFKVETEKTHINQEFKWTNLKTFDTESLDLPIDKIVIKKLKAQKKLR